MNNISATGEPLTCPHGVGKCVCSICTAIDKAFESKTPTPNRGEDKLPAFQGPTEDIFQALHRNHAGHLAALKENARLTRELKAYEIHLRAAENVLGHSPASARSICATAQKWVDRAEQAEAKANRYADHIGAISIALGTPVGKNSEQYAKEVVATLAMRDEEIARLKSILCEVFIVMSGAEGCNAPFDAERWSKCVLRVEDELTKRKDSHAR